MGSILRKIYLYIDS